MAQLKQIRWTLEVAATEFEISRATLSSRIKNAGILPGADKKFSTRDIRRAVYTDGETARAELANSQRELIDLKKMKLAGELVYASQCQQLWDSVVIGLRQKISDSPLPEETKREILKDLQAIPLDDYIAKNTRGSAEDDSAELEVA